MLHIDYTTQFKRDLKLAKRRQKPLKKISVHDKIFRCNKIQRSYHYKKFCRVQSKKIQAIMEKIAAQESLDKKLFDHPLTGEWRGFRELHIKPDWLLIYEITSDNKTVIFTRTGTHSDLF